MYIRTDFVQSSRRRVHPNPPVPSSTMPLAAADRISEGLCAPLAPTCLGRAHRSPRSNDIIPRGTGRLEHRRRCDLPASRSNLRLCGARARLLGIALMGPLRVRRQHHGTFSARIFSGLSSSRTDWDLGRVLNAIRASVSEARRIWEWEQGVYTCMSSFYQITYTFAMGSLLLSHRGMHESAHIWEVRPRLPPSPFDALLNAQRLNTAISLGPPPHTLYIALPYRRVSVSAAPRPPINNTLRPRRGLVNGRYEPLTTGARVLRVLSPSSVASIRFECSSSWMIPTLSAS
ncbi:hypothetical protein K438DRAFT_1784778 [Mycena galopus ATCC 62051]|nr:hypothetical protein K438DRAFT_1784778 [Mycena galopus ATCC 62051]